MVCVLVTVGPVYLPVSLVCVLRVTVGPHKHVIVPFVVACKLVSEDHCNLLLHHKVLFHNLTLKYLYRLECPLLFS